MPIENLPIRNLLLLLKRYFFSKQKYLLYKLRATFLYFIQSY